MRVLITGSGSMLGAALTKALAPNHDIRTLDLTAGTSDAPPAYVGDPLDRTFAAQAVQDCDAIIHTLPLAPRGSQPTEILDAATRGTYNLITSARAERFILLSTLRIFERYPAQWWVTERWAPRPTTAIDDLAPYLAELVVRETSRTLPVKGIALRLGTVVSDDQVKGHSPDWRWLHIDDAVQAVQRALAFTPLPDEPQTGWWVFHIPGGGRCARFALGEAGQPPFSYAPRHDLTGGVPLAMSDVLPVPRPWPPAVSGGTARRVVIYGAGGPLGAVTAETLARDHVLRLTDMRPIAEIAAQRRGAEHGNPVPSVLGTPHEAAVVDIRDPEQVVAAARGMDAIINCSVIRRDPVQSFLVNTIGTYNVMQAALACGIRRIVHTGPAQGWRLHPGTYWYDFNVPPDAPPRPGIVLYTLTKYLGMEICRIFAEEHGLEVPTLLFSRLVNPDFPPAEPLGAFPFTVSWQDAGEAMRLALHAPSFPHPFEMFNINADLPHGKYPNDKAKELLKWQPRDRLESHWLRDQSWPERT